MSNLMNPHFWLAEINQYGYGKLVDGPHDTRAGVEQALYLFRGLGLERDRTYACAEVILTPIEAIAHDVNHEPVATLNAIGLKP